MDGNLIAKHTALSVDFLVNELGAVGSWEQPAGSYMFPYLETLGLPMAQPDKVILLHQCKFGRPWKKAHHVHVLWWLAPACTRQTLYFIVTVL